MKKLYIIGAGGLGKEVYKIIEDAKLDFSFSGFVDAKNNLNINIGKIEHDVISQEFFLNNVDIENSAVVIAIGNPNLLKKVYLLCKNKGINDFPNIIHPTAYVSDTAKLGKGNIIGQNCVVSVDVVIGNFNIINLNSTIGHDTTIKSFNIINPGSNISGGVQIGDENLIGTNSTILQYLKIGNNTTISAGAMISRAVEDNHTLVGNPARIISKTK